MLYFGKQDAQEGEKSLIRGSFQLQEGGEECGYSEDVYDSLEVVSDYHQSKKNLRHKGKRMSTVEPVFGHLINFLGMKKVNTRGIQQANKCMLMAACAHNLKKLLKYTPPKTKTLANVLEIPQQVRNSLTNTLKPLVFILKSLMSPVPTHFQKSSCSKKIFKIEKIALLKIKNIGKRGVVHQLPLL